ncbi:hypothetical protein ORL62_23190 [Bacillus cereus]|nr:hypothetical protein [Bacillus cereus]MDA2645008.1 hypothetical protein [Bacillus cereus]MDC7729544.1 hypothetical protein [Bacillus cereus]MDZ4410777.1 hypothetical protein [Bacillus cereus]
MTVQKEKVTRRIVCRKCKSDQLVGNKRVFNFKRMFLILFLMLAPLIAGLASISNSYKFSTSWYSHIYCWIYYAPRGTNNFIQWIYW